ncbi:MAG: hypothetical protein E7449_03360 [Ruminococcaceae bacterium]|nr:hypothetical protein [Oscillospiraceae bacterium]
MNEIYVPVLHFFENGNPFTGSFGPLRFFLKPDAETITAKIWHGVFCMEKSEIEQERQFPLTAEGREELIAWLEEVK